MLTDGGSQVLVHTINDAETMVRLRRDGVHGIYTDSITPETWMQTSP